MSEQLELFPTEVGYELSPQEELQSQGSIEVSEEKLIQDSEWCFQFFNNEPVVFAYQQDEKAEPTPLILQIQPKESEALNFKQNGMMFRIFPRPISEESKIERQNASKDKEA